VRRLRLLLVGVLALVGLRRRKPPTAEERIVPEKGPDRRAENALIALLLVAAACSVAFVFFYATSSIGHQTQWLGLSLGLALAFLAAALILLGKRLVVSEELEEDYPAGEHPDDEEAIAQIVEQSGAGFTRKGLVKAAGGAAAVALGAAIVAPAASLGPVTGTNSLYDTPWKRGRRLVDQRGRPFDADEVESGTFYTAFPEGASRDDIAAPLIVVRLAPGDLRLPPARKSWAPEGILAYSKICTHAACSIALYRKPTFPPVEPRPAFVCPCHYSTFDPATGGTVIYGPAGRDLPQLPLAIDASRNLRAAGNFSGPVGPSWWGVRLRGPGNPRS
jgi:ubiquinol-cytochrome c reductase iron-sulfur subunit